MGRKKTGGEAMPHRLPASEIVQKFRDKVSRLEDDEAELKRKLSDILESGVNYAYAFSTYARPLVRTRAMLDQASLIVHVLTDESLRDFRARMVEVVSIGERTRHDAVDFACRGPQSSTNAIDNELDTAGRTAVYRFWAEGLIGGVLGEFVRYLDPDRYEVEDDLAACGGGAGGEGS